MRGVWKVCGEHVQSPPKEHLWGREDKFKGTASSRNTLKKNCLYPPTPVLELTHLLVGSLAPSCVLFLNSYQETVLSFDRIFKVLQTPCSTSAALKTPLQAWNQFPPTRRHSLRLRCCPAANTRFSHSFSSRGFFFRVSSLRRAVWGEPRGRCGGSRKMGFA